MKIKKKNKDLDKLTRDSVIDDLKFENKFLRGLCIAFILCYGLILFLSKVHAYDTTVESHVMDLQAINDSNLSPWGRATVASYYDNLFNYVDTNYLVNDYDFMEYKYVFSSRNYTAVNQNQQFQNIWYSKCPWTSSPDVTLGTSSDTPYTSCDYIFITLYRVPGSNNVNYNKVEVHNTDGRKPASSYFRQSGIQLYNSNLNTWNNPYYTNYGTNYYYTIDFSSYGRFTYEGDYLDSNVNFKKECLNAQNTSFSVIPQNIDTSADSDNFTYILFPGFLNNYTGGVLSFANGSNSLYLTDDFTFENDFKFFDYSVMNNLLDNNTYVQMFNTAYPGVYRNLYGYNLFVVGTGYDSDNSAFVTPVFTFKDSYLSKTYCMEFELIPGTHQQLCFESMNINGTINEYENGVVTDIDNNLVIPEENICFYIPVDSDLKVWNIDEFGDIDNDTITIDDVTYNIDSDTQKNGFWSDINGNSYSGFIGYLKTLIEQLSTPITFISNKISELFGVFPKSFQFLIISIISLGFIFGIIKLLTGGK